MFKESSGSISMSTRLQCGCECSEALISRLCGGGLHLVSPGSAWAQSEMVMMVFVKFPWGVIILSVTTLLMAELLVSWGLCEFGTARKILRLSDLFNLVPVFLSSPGRLITSISTWLPLSLRISLTWLMVSSTRSWPLIFTILSPVLNLPSLSITLPGSMWAMTKPLVLLLLVMITPKLSLEGLNTIIFKYCCLSFCSLFARTFILTLCEGWL